jgi:hypothetical protein
MIFKSESTLTSTLYSSDFSTSTPTVCSNLRVFDIGLSTDIRLHSNLSYYKTYAEGNNMNVSDRRGDFLAL